MPKKLKLKPAPEPKRLKLTPAEPTRVKLTPTEPKPLPLKPAEDA